MKKKNLIIVIASCVMLLAYFVLPFITGVKASAFGESETQNTDDTVSMFYMLKDSGTPALSIILLVLTLCSSLYLLLDSFRDKLKDFSFIEKIVIPEKVAFLLPVILVLLVRFLYKPKGMELLSGLGAKISMVYGMGFYLFLLAAIVVAALVWVKSPALEEKV
ncbi:MAG: hypothetical protein IJS63_05610 [Bacteroidaceae bacterium]|nr:hypothetical protein [Bacteroidaceae bacterium]